MKKIGMIVAVETAAIFKRYPDIKEFKSPKGFEVYYRKDDDFDLYIIHSGMSTINAAQKLNI